MAFCNSGSGGCASLRLASRRSRKTQIERFLGAATEKMPGEEMAKMYGYWTLFQKSHNSTSVPVRAIDASH